MWQEQARRSPEPERITEATLLRERRERERLGAAASGAATTVLSLWQPLASFLAYGLQRVEGRGWSTEFRGPLWIHAGSKKPEQEDIDRWESIYREAYALDGVEAKFPEAYPTSALVGYVEVVDVVSAEEFSKWQALPPGVKLEGRRHGSGSLFLVERHKRLMVPQKMGGQHKFWRLDSKAAKRLVNGLMDSIQGQAIDFKRFKELSEAGVPPPPPSKMPSSYAHLHQDSQHHDDGQQADEEDDDQDLEDAMLELAIQRSLAEADDRKPVTDRAAPSRSQSQQTTQIGETPVKPTSATRSGHDDEALADPGPAEPRRRGRWGRNRGSDGAQNTTS